MPLDRLTIRAKKSLSGLFGLGDRRESSASEPGRLVDEQNENETPGFDGSDPLAPDAGSAVPEAYRCSPCKDSPSKRQNLMGSLRQRSLRSIGSLRKLRSPNGKTKQVDGGSPTPAEKMRTPKRDLSRSFMLNFQRSPPGQPLKHEDSISSLEVQHSSPMPIPSADSQNARHHAPSVIPDGTIPDSPGPLQKKLDKDQAEDPPSPTERLSTSFGPELTRCPARSSASTIISNPESSLSKSLKEAADREPEENALAILGRNYYARIYRRADGKSRIRFELIDHDPEDDEHDYPREKHVIIPRNVRLDVVGLVVQSVETYGNLILQLNNALAAGKIPEFLDVDLEWDEKNEVKSRVLKRANMRIHDDCDVDSPFRKHKGLYDGTGYGRSSTDSTCADDAAAKKADFVKQFQEKLRLQEDTDSPPATAVAETVASCADVPGSFPSDEVESSKIEGKL